MKDRYEVNRPSAIKSALVLLSYTIVFIFAVYTKNIEMRIFAKGFLLGTWFWPVFGITKWSWELPVIKRIKE